MNRKHLSLLLILSTLAAATMMIVISHASPTTLQWPLTELGPAVVQGSYFYGAPALESPFGMIGDIPGGYSIYSGNPLAANLPGNLSAWIVTNSSIHIGAPGLDVATIIALLALFLMPVAVLLSLGRRSYGASKTR